MLRSEGITYKFLSACALFCLFMVGTVDAEDDKAAIDKIRIAFNEAFNKGDSDAFAKLIDNDGRWMPPGEPPLIGKANIVQRYKELFSKTNTRIELKTEDIQASGSMAFMSGSFSRTDLSKVGAPPGSVAGHYLFVLKKQPDSSWKIFRDIWNEKSK